MCWEEIVKIGLQCSESDGFFILSLLPTGVVGVIFVQTGCRRRTRTRFKREGSVHSSSLTRLFLDVYDYNIIYA